MKYIETPDGIGHHFHDRTACHHGTDNKKFHLNFRITTKAKLGDICYFAGTSKFDPDSEYYWKVPYSEISHLKEFSPSFHPSRKLNPFSKYNCYRTNEKYVPLLTTLDCLFEESSKPTGRPVWIDRTLFPSITAAAKHLKTTRYHIKKMVKAHIHCWFPDELEALAIPYLVE